MTAEPLVVDSIRRLESLQHEPFLPASTVGLRRILHLLSRLGNPHRMFRSIHIAGSSGKGSTATMIAAVLQEAGLRTGCFRSPHLVSWQERIAIDNRDITSDQWLRCFDEVWPIVQSMRNGTEIGYELGRPAIFEVLFAMTALHFAHEGIDWAVVETGLGGRLDATNALQSEVAVITNVSLEHTHILGTTVELIATEKAAIIKAGCHAVTAARDPGALAVIENRAHAEGVPLCRVGQDVTYRILSQDLTGQVVELTRPGGAIELELSALGRFQAENAATAAAAVRSLHDRGLQLSPHVLTAALARTSIPGRFEVISQHPLIVIDGAHNPAAAAQLANTARELLASRSIVLVFAAMADKDVDAIAAALGPIVGRVVVTTVPNSGRGADPQRVAASFAAYLNEVSVVDSVGDALEEAIRNLHDHDALLVTGSMYLIGSARNRVLHYAGVR